MADSETADKVNICPYCKNGVSKKKLECKQCDKIWHVSCAKRKYKLTDTEKESFICCRNGDEMEDDDDDEDYLRRENILLKAIIDDKETIINDKKMIIEHLKEKIALLNEKLQNYLSSESTSTICNIPEMPKNHIVRKNEAKLIISSSQQKSTLLERDETEGNQLEQKSTKVSNRNRRPPNQLDHNSNGELVIQDLTTVTNRNRRPLIRGTNLECGQDTQFAGVNKRAWLHIGNVATNATDESVLVYLQNKFPGRKFTAEKLPVRTDARSCSFKVSADLDLMEDIYAGKNWPSDVTVRRFKFFHAKRPTVGEI